MFCSTMAACLVRSATRIWRESQSPWITRTGFTVLRIMQGEAGFTVLRIMQGEAGFTVLTFTVLHFGLLISKLYKVYCSLNYKSFNRV